MKDLNINEAQFLEQSNWALEAQTRTNQRITNRRETQTTSSLSTSISLSLSHSLSFTAKRNQNSQSKATKPKPKDEDEDEDFMRLESHTILWSESEFWNQKQIHGEEKRAPPRRSQQRWSPRQARSLRGTPWYSLSIYMYVCMYVCMYKEDKFFEFWSFWFC